MGNSIRRKLAGHEPQLPSHTQDPHFPPARAHRGLAFLRAVSTLSRGFGSALLPEKYKTNATLLAWESTGRGWGTSLDSLNQQGTSVLLYGLQQSLPGMQNKHPYNPSPQPLGIPFQMLTNKKRGGHYTTVVKMSSSQS